MRPTLDAIRRAAQIDACRRGLDSPTGDAMFDRTAGDYATAAASLARGAAHVAVLTGFWIPSASRPETDGPLGAVYLARTLPQLGIGVTLLAEEFCHDALRAGLAEADVTGVEVSTFPERDAVLSDVAPGATHLLALERVGPGYDGKMRTMRGIDITAHMRDGAALFASRGDAVTIGIGDGGNEIGMGSIARDFIAARVPRGDEIACHVATDHLLVAGISNWGAYALTAATSLLLTRTIPLAWLDADTERRILTRMVRDGGLIDGVTGEAAATVDGLSFDEYSRVFDRIRAALEGRA